MSNILDSILNLLFVFTNDLGVSIVLLTLAIKTILLPLSIKQKLDISKQKIMNEEINRIKEKYRDNKSKADQELNEYYMKNKASLFGCLTMFLQLPIIISLFNVIKGINIDSQSVIVPWVSSLTASDSSYLIPIMYAVISLAPSLLGYIPYLKTDGEKKSVLQSLVTVVIMSALIVLRSPVALGIYFITSSMVSLIESIIYRLIVRHKKISKMNS